MIIVSTANYWLLIPTLIMSVLLFALRYVYINSARSLKRIEAISKCSQYDSKHLIFVNFETLGISPVFSHTNGSLQGSTTIRAFGATAALRNEFYDHLDYNTEAWYLKSMTTRAFSLWLDLTCLLYISTVTLSFVIFNASGKNHTHLY